MNPRSRLSPCIGALLVFPLVAATTTAQLPAFTGADGAGQYASGGRGGVVYHVTKLDRNFSDAEIGTLRYGLNNANFPADTRRTIVFDVGGTFWLGRYGAERREYNNGWDAQSNYGIPSNVTIAGQTAPGPVIIMGGVTKCSGSNVVMRNITFATGYGMRGFDEPDKDPPRVPTPGDYPDSSIFESLQVSGQNVMLDHLTAVYASAVTIWCRQSASNVTMQYCTLGQGQNYPQGIAGNPGQYTGLAYGMYAEAGAYSKFSVLNNLHAHSKSPLVVWNNTVGTGPVNDFRNNITYNWLTTAGFTTSSGSSGNNFINNFYLAGPGGDNASGTNIVYSPGQTGIYSGNAQTRTYLSGNLKDTNNNGYLDDTSSADGDYFNTSPQSGAENVNIGVTLDASNGFRNVLLYVGSRWWERDYDFNANNTNVIDTVDERLVHETWTGTGKVMAWADDPFDTSPSEGLEWRAMLALRADSNTFAAPFNWPVDWDTDGDGMPGWWELEHGLDPGVANNNADFDLDGYTDLEEYLNDVAAWPAPGEIVFTGSTNNRYAQIRNWKVTGVNVNISGIGDLPTSSPWQPSRYDTALIGNQSVLVDSVGQLAGTLRMADNATLDITNGWLKVANTLEIGISNAATVNLSAGHLYAATITKGGSGVFNFTGGTLTADTVNFDLVNQGGAIAPGTSPGQMVVNGELILQSGSSLDFELGAANTNDSDNLVVNGDLTLGGTLNVTNLSGFGVGTYTLITYTGTLSGSLGLGSMPGGLDYLLDTSTANEVRLVVLTGLPTFESISRQGSNLVMTGTGPTNETFHLLTSSDLLLPISMWTPVETNSFNSGGQVMLTNTATFYEPQRFYRLRLP